MESLRWNEVFLNVLVRWSIGYIAKNIKILSTPKWLKKSRKLKIFFSLQFHPKPSTLTKKYPIFTNKQRLDAMLNLVKSIRLAPFIAHLVNSTILWSLELFSKVTLASAISDSCTKIPTWFLFSNWRFSDRGAGYWAYHFVV